MEPISVDLLFDEEVVRAFWLSLDAKSRNHLATRLCAMAPVCVSIDSAERVQQKDQFAELKQGMMQIMHEVTKYRQGPAKGRSMELDLVSFLTKNLGGTMACTVTDMSQSKTRQGDIHLESKSADGKTTCRLALGVKHRVSNVTAEEARTFALMVAETPTLHGGVYFASGNITGKGRFTNEPCAGDIELEYVGTHKPILYLSHQQDAGLLATVCGLLLNSLLHMPSQTATADGKKEADPSALLLEQWRRLFQLQVVHIKSYLAQLDQLDKQIASVDRVLQQLRKTSVHMRSIGSLWMATFPEEQEFILLPPQLGSESSTTTFEPKKRKRATAAKPS